MEPITTTVTTGIEGGITGTQYVGTMDAATIAALAAFAGIWGGVVAVIITIMDSRKPLETWKKLTWSLILCFAPFLIFFAVDVALNGLHSIVVGAVQAVQNSLTSMGGAGIGHGGQALAEKNKAARVAASSGPPTMQLGELPGAGAGGGGGGGAD